MKKSFLFWMFAMLMLVVGMSSCSSDDDFDFSTIDANELSICSDKGESEIILMLIKTMQLLIQTMVCS